MAVGLIAWGRFEQTDAEGNVVLNADGSPVKITVPAPPTDPGKPWLYDFLRTQAGEIGKVFDVVQYPPSSMAQGGTGAGCDGYGVAWRWNLGWTSPTRYGPLESLLASIAALRSAGSLVYGDLVLHQLVGPENGGPGISTYHGADRTAMNGRGATTPGWFRGHTSPILDENGQATGVFKDPIPPFCREDDVPSVQFDYPFGREISYQHCLPKNATLQDAIDFLGFLIARLNLSGFRFDDTKGTWPEAVARIMASTKLPFYSEYFDGNPNNLNYWATQAPMNSRSGVEDFTAHWAIQDACNNFTARPLVDSGFWQTNSGLSVVFVDNPDTDTSPGQQVVSNKRLAYAFLFTIPSGLALVYGKDYFPSSVWPGAYGLHEDIDNLAWIGRMFAFGKSAVPFVDDTVLVMSRDGDGGAVGWSGGLLTALNFDTWNARTITCGTPFGPNRWLHDYTGHHPDIWTDSAGQATFTIPSNANAEGRSYLCFSPGGVNAPVPRASRYTTHVFYGDATLDVMPLHNGVLKLPQRIYCEQGSGLSVLLTLNRSGLSRIANASISIVGPDGGVRAQANTGGTDMAAAYGNAAVGGWHTITLYGNLMPTDGAKFRISAIYKGSHQ